MEEKDPINLLIDELSKELHVEIAINEDSSAFWKKAQSYIFDNSIASIREGIKALSDAMGESPDLYNYFTTFTLRVFSQPFTRVALKNFVSGFDEIGNDTFFRGALGFESKDMTPVEHFLLFICVHRNQIQLAMFAADEAKRKAIEEGKNKNRTR